MGVLYLLEVQAKPGTGAEVVEFLNGIRSDPGEVDGLEATAYQGLDDSDTIVVVEHWASDEHHDRYAAGKQADAEELVKRLAQLPSLRRFRAVEK